MVWRRKVANWVMAAAARLIEAACWLDPVPLPVGFHDRLMARLAEDRDAEQVPWGGGESD